MSPFLAWGDFHVRSRFARSTIPEEKWGTTSSLARLAALANGQDGPRRRKRALVTRLTYIKRVGILLVVNIIIICLIHDIEI